MKFRLFLLFNISLGFVLSCCGPEDGTEPVTHDTFHIILKTTHGKVIKDKDLEHCSTENGYLTPFDSSHVAIVFWGEDQQGGGSNEFNLYLRDNRTGIIPISENALDSKAYFHAQAVWTSSEWFTCNSGVVHVTQFDRGTNETITGEIINAILVNAQNDTLILDGTFSHRVTVNP